MHLDFYRRLNLTQSIMPRRLGHLFPGGMGIPPHVGAEPYPLFQENLRASLGIRAKNIALFFQMERQVWKALAMSHIQIERTPNS